MRARPRAEPALVYSAAAICGAASVLGTVETVLSIGPRFSSLPGLAGIPLALLVLLVGPRLPRSVVFLIAPLGVVLIGVALATTRGYSDAAILYCWPVLWAASFYDTRRVAFVIALTAVTHAVALTALPDHTAGLDRWLDVVGSVIVAGIVVRALAARNQRLVAQLSTEARVDPLTGLWNRRAFGERLETESARAVRDQTPLAVVAFDVDHFKEINDVHGHDHGDRVLVRVAEILARETRGADITARVGGEEFVVVLPGTDTAGAREFAERVRLGVAREDGEVRLTISAGVAAAVPRTVSHGLVDAADRALYAAKDAGRNTVRIAESTGAAA